MGEQPITVRSAFAREARAQLDVKPHSHGMTQWYHCVSGGMTASIDGVLFGLRAGDSVLVPPHAQRALWRSGRPPTYIVVLFYDRGLGLAGIHKRLLGLTEELVPDRQALLRELGGLGDPDSNWLVEAIVTRILIGLRREAEQADAQEPRRRYVDSRDEAARRALVQQVEAVMKRNLAHSLRREDIAELVNISAPHLARLFKQATSKTLHTRMTELRMAQAASLLHDSTLTISQVAGEVGFGSFSHFTKAFRSAHGVTPSDYRKQALD
ncbi:MAG: AraC family transcriptional regulator [Planctomycetota bacterium]|nr:AraC family transcriptional regulator [Planctomycetota bacterium]